MKKYNKIIVAFAIVVVLILIIAPSVLKSKVTKLMIDKIESSTNYQVKFNELDVAFFRNFPEVKVDVTSFLLQSPSATVLDVEHIKVHLSFAQLMKNELDVLEVELQSPTFNYTLLSSQDKVSDVDTIISTPHSSSRPSFFSSFNVESFSITNGELVYQTVDSLNLTLHGVDLLLQGNLDESDVLASVQLSIAALNYSAQGFSLRSIPVTFDAEMGFHKETAVLELKDNALKVGGFSTSIVGSVDVSDTPDVDLTFDAPHTDIKGVLALLPKTLIQDLDHITADGQVSLNGFIKGKYENLNLLPAYGINFSVVDAWFKYADLHSKVEAINMKATVSHPDGSSADMTTIAVDYLSMRSGKNEFSSQLEIAHPTTDVAVKGNLKSQLDFMTLKDAIPMSAFDIIGEVYADISFDGKLSDIEQENYQDFDASGQLKLTNYYLKSKAIPQGLKISNASMKFTPERINIQTFKGVLGTSDLRVSGYLSNYFAYLFDNKVLDGELKVNAQHVDLNEFLAASNEYNASASTSATSFTTREKGPFIVPDDLNIVFDSSIRTLKVDDVLLERFIGNITIKDAKVLLNNLNFATLDGTVNVNGQYNSQNATAVYSDMDLKISKVDMAKATTSISVLRNMMPISQTTQGEVSSVMHYYAKLDAVGDVDLNSIVSKGYISSPGLRIANNKSLDGLAKQLNDPRYSDITTSAIKIDYMMEKGIVTLAPFDVKMVDKNINAAGWYSIQNQLSFKIKTTVKAKEIGGDVSKYIGMVSDVNKPLPVTIILTGDAKDPNVKYDTREAIKILRKDVTKNLNKDAINSIIKGFF